VAVDMADDVVADITGYNDVAVEKDADVAADRDNDVAADIYPLSFKPKLKSKLAHVITID
jgi:hypothetical protein